MNKQEFIKKIGKASQEGWKSHQILPSLTIAQAILESNWGKSKLTVEANNLFGMKCGTKWKGAKYTIKTREQKKDGTNYYIVADFRKYSSWGDCCVDHGVFLSTKRYEKVRGEKNYKLACKYIKEAGYATDLNYTDLLIRLIEQNNLNEYDKIVFTKPTSTVAPNSPYNDVIWLQIKLNKLINAGLVEDGIWGDKTRLAVIKYWELLGWNTNEKGHAGTKTIRALSENRKK